MLVGISEGDDAGIVRLEPGKALVHTIDVITPIVDDPKTFGQIAAANAVSDVFAMGGKPVSAVSLLAVPKELPRRAVGPILKGAETVLRKAGAALVGGHTIKDRELKLGFAVTGFVDPRRMTTVDRGRAGQVLVLTKALGTGVLYQAMKAGVLRPREKRAAAASMTALNQGAAEVMLENGVRCATDVTGFGLVGHALNIARHSDVDVVLDAEALPSLPGVMSYLGQGIFPGTAEVNLEGYGRGFGAEPGVPRERVLLAADPQTSGGVLMAVPTRRAEAARAACSGWIVGRLEARSRKTPRVRLVRGGSPV